VSRGFQAGENVVTVQSVVYATVPTTTGGSRALDHLETFAEVIGGTMFPWAHVALNWGKFYPLFVISPSVARVIAKDGLSKNDVKRYLYENTKTSAKSMERLAWQGGLTSFNLCQMAADGLVSKEYCLSEDPERMVPVFIKPEWIGIIVSGDPGRARCRGYVQNHEQGPPVGKKVLLPPDWKQLLESYSK